MAICPLYCIYSVENTSPSYSVLEGYEGLFVENNLKLKSQEKVKVSPLKHNLQITYIFPNLNPLSFSRLMEE